MPIQELSQRYNSLQVAIELLRKDFKIKVLLEKSKTTDPEDFFLEHRTTIRSYLALTHAELETYFEGRALEIVNTLEKFWISFPNTVYPLLDFNKDSEANIKTKSKSSDSKTFEELVIENIRKRTGIFRNKISNNNGIKKKDVRALFHPFGLDFGTLDSAWLENLEVYGKKRGDAVHQSSEMQKRIVISDVEKELEEILAGAQDFDSYITVLLSKVDLSKECTAQSP